MPRWRRARSGYICLRARVAFYLGEDESRLRGLAVNPVYVQNQHTYRYFAMKEQVLESCKRMLAPAIRLFLRAGIGWTEFAEIGKQLFVDVARKDYGLQGRPTNSARVALMTGLSRREVARVRQVLTGEAPSPAATHRNRISQVLSGWHLDPDFLDAAGRPAALPMDGETTSVSALLDRYGGDMPRGVLVKELSKLGLIRETEQGYTVQARDYIRTPADADMLRQGGQAIHDHATTVVHNIAADRSSPPRFERMATHIEVDPNDAAAFADFLTEKGQAFLEEMDRWLASRKAATGHAPAKRKAIRTGVGMYLIHDETQGTQDNA
jgi:hypothetical protein